MREQRGGNRIMAVGEDVRFNADLIAHGTFRGKAPAVHFRRDSFNNDAPASFWLFRAIFVSSFLAVTSLKWCQRRLESSRSSICNELRFHARSIRLS